MELTIENLGKAVMMKTFFWITHQRSSSCTLGKSTNRQYDSNLLESGNIHHITIKNEREVTLLLCNDFLLATPRHLGMNAV